MGVFEFLLILVGMIIIGIWGLIIISARCGLLNDEKKNKEDNKE